MNKQRFLYAILCAFGAMVAGACASELHSIWGLIAFSAGIGVMVHAIFNLSK